MGNWNINIQGVGAHHNKKYLADANEMVADFVKRLKEAGHTIQHATFTHGGAETMVDSKEFHTGVGLKPEA